MHTLTEYSNKGLRCDGLCAATTASSANRISFILVFFTFVFTFKREGLNSLQLVRVCKYISSSAASKACLSSSETRIPKSVGASTHLA